MPHSERLGRRRPAVSGTCRARRDLIRLVAVGALALGVLACDDPSSEAAASRTTEASVSAGPRVRPRVGLALHGAGGRFEIWPGRHGGRAGSRFAFGRGDDEWPIAGDWDGDGLDSVGVFRPSTSTFHLRDTLEAGPEDRRVAFGDPRWAGIPLAGDWDGDGIDTPGVYVRADSSFHLTDATITSTPDHVFVFGPPRASWWPIVGDWDGDGRDSVGVYDPERGVFHLTNRLAGGVAEVSFAFGPAATHVIPIAGDWQGLDRDGVGFFDPASSEFKLRYATRAGAADERIHVESDLLQPRPLTGRWSIGTP